MVVAKGESWIASRIKMYTGKAITAVNEILKLKEIRKISMKFAEQIYETDVAVTYNRISRSFKIAVQCVICGRPLVLSRTEYSISAANYELHLIRKHMSPKSEKAPGPKSEKKKKLKQRYTCDDCGQIFRTWTYLRSHNKSHHGVKRVFEW